MAKKKAPQKRAAAKPKAKSQPQKTQKPKKPRPDHQSIPAEVESAVEDTLAKPKPIVTTVNWNEARYYAEIVRTISMRQTAYQMRKDMEQDFPAHVWPILSQQCYSVSDAILQLEDILVERALKRFPAMKLPNGVISEHAPTPEPGPADAC